MIAEKFFADINFMAVIAAGAAYWLIGAVWFSVFFGKTWSEELQRHGIKIHKPGQSTMISKFIVTFLLNLIIAFGIAFFVHYVDTTTVVQAIKLGLIIGFCFAAAVMYNSYIWESRPVKLIFIDIGYPIFGIMAATILLSLWR